MRIERIRRLRTRRQDRRFPLKTPSTDSRRHGRPTAHEARRHRADGKGRRAQKFAARHDGAGWRCIRRFSLCHSDLLLRMMRSRKMQRIFWADGQAVKAVDTAAAVYAPSFCIDAGRRTSSLTGTTMDAAVRVNDRAEHAEPADRPQQRPHRTDGMAVGAAMTP